MSEPVREWRFYVGDMVTFGEKVLAYTAGLDQAAFVANPLVLSSSLRVVQWSQPI